MTDTRLSVKAIVASPRLTDEVIAGLPRDSATHYGVGYDIDFGDRHHFFVINTASGQIYYSHHEPRFDELLPHAAERWKHALWESMYEQAPTEALGGLDDD